MASLSGGSVFLPQVAALTLANLKSRYRKTLAGFLWVLINPLVLYSVQSLVFKKFLKLDVPNYSLFLLSGLLPWIFISQSLEMCTPVFVNASHLLKSFQLPPLVYLFAQLFDNLINFLAAFALILTPVLVTLHSHSWRLLLLPFAVTLLLFGVLGMTWLLATAQVFFRDTRFILSFALSVAFFLTPIFYPESFVPDAFRWLIHFNPLYLLIKPFHCVIYGGDTSETYWAFVFSTLVSVTFMTIAKIIWSFKRNAIYFNI